MTISLRNLPPQIEKAIRETSRREHISLNKAAIRLLGSAFPKPAGNSDFDEFLGAWTEAEGEAFDAALRRMRQVEPCDWENAR
ncbi:MAG: hypothetical protein IT167_20080 [Bryobacterales bacterium]|nr:hypothetical protein [Bryobacterales bacterium]